MKHDPEALAALCQQLAEQLGVPGIILITLDPGRPTGFTVCVPDQIATEVPPTLWMLGDHFCEALGIPIHYYVADDDADDATEPAGEDTRKH